MIDESKPLNSRLKMLAKLVSAIKNAYMVASAFFLQSVVERTASGKKLRCPKNELRRTLEIKKGSASI